MYSVYHGSTVSKDKIIINSNDRALEKIRAWQKQSEDEKRRQRKAAAEKYLGGLPKSENGDPLLEQNEDGSVKIPLGDDGEPLFSVDENGVPFFEEEEENEEEVTDPTPVISEDERKKIIDAANSEAASIIEKAKEEADALFLNTRDKAVNQGYNDGLAKAHEELEDKLNSLNVQSETLEKNYRQKESSLEKEVLDTVLNVVQKAFGIEFGDDSELLLRLVDNCLNHVDSAKELLIRVNENNYTLLTSKRGEIEDKVGEGVNIEFAKDPLLTDGQCMIETDGGVYDVSIDTELKNLIKRIRLLTL